VAAQPDLPVSKRFIEIAEAVLTNLTTVRRPAPAIRFV
jgi:predicted alternative tryptophan synthase beta-subunit